jgi:methionine synthase II (cobalamin-independent)
MFPPFFTTGIGSLPHADPEEACRLVFETFDMPFWPQLPGLSFRESMIAQFSEGMPSLRVDEQRKTVWIDKNDDDLQRFYETYSVGWELTISEDYAKGLHAFLKTIRDQYFKFLKGHVTGPLTFTLGLKDADGRLVYFDEELREVALIVLKAKIKWQIETLKRHAETVVIFIDEPILSALGSSSYIGVAPEEALRLLKETSDSIKESGGIPGIHCCGKADWPLVINSGVDVISFDAYDYIESIALYPAEFTGFLRSGGHLAWGVVPTTESINEENAGSIRTCFDEGLERLSKSMPADLLLSQILLTPSCGTGSRRVEEAVKVFSVLVELKKLLKKTYL